MIKNKSIKFITTRVVIITSAILTVNYDYFVTHEFNIEPVFLIGVNILLLTSIVKLIKRKGFNKAVSLMLSGFIVIISIYNLFILGLLSFGYGFTGREMPAISVIGFIMSVLILIIAGLDFFGNFKYITRTNH